MSSRLSRALLECVAGTPLAQPLAERLDALADSRIFESAPLPSEPVLRGLARLLACDGESARTLAHRPAVFARL